MAGGSRGGKTVYLVVYGGLLALTVVTVLASYVDMGLMNVVVALLIASSKASLVALFFMHLKGERPLVWGFALVPLLFLALIVMGTLVDMQLR